MRFSFLTACGRHLVCQFLSIMLRYSQPILRRPLRKVGLDDLSQLASGNDCKPRAIVQEASDGTNTQKTRRLREGFDLDDWPGIRHFGVPTECRGQLRAIREPSPSNRTVFRNLQTSESTQQSADKLPELLVQLVLVQLRRVRARRIDPNDVEALRIFICSSPLQLRTSHDRPWIRFKQNTT